MVRERRNSNGTFLSFVKGALGSGCTAALILALATTSSAQRHPFQLSEQELGLIELGKAAETFTSPDDLPALTKSWNQFKEGAQQIRSVNSHIPGRWLKPVALLGDDALWNDYAAWFQQNCPGLIPVYALLPFARPSLKHRLSPLLQAQIATLRPDSFKLSRRMYARCANVARLLGDDESIRLLIEKSRQLPPVRGTGVDAMWQQLNLRQGDPRASMPVIWARPGLNDRWTVLWSLAGITDRYGLVHVLDIGGEKLHRAVDLSILASEDNVRFTSIYQLSSAPFQGSLVLPVPTRTRFLALDATNRVTGETRRSKILILASANAPVTHAFDVPAESAASTNDRVIPEHPFGLEESISGVDLSSGEAVEIARLPWNHGYSTTLSVWACFEGDATLYANILDREGNLVRRQVLAMEPSDVYLPVWTQESVTLYSQKTINPHTIVLSATFRRVGPRQKPNPLLLDTKAPNILWLTDLRRRDYEPDPAPAGTEILAGAPSPVTAMSSDDTGEFLALGLKGGRLALMDTNDGSVRQSGPGARQAFWFVGASPDRVVAVDDARGVLVMDRRSLAMRQLGTLNAALIPKTRRRIQLSPDGRWLVWIGKESDVFAILVGAAELGEPIRIPVGKYPALMIDRNAETLHVAGSASKISIAFRDLQNANPDEFPRVPDHAATSSVAEYTTTWNSYWVDPIHGLYINRGGLMRRNTRDLLFSFSGSFALLTTTPHGIVYLASSSGLIRRFYPASVKGYTMPEKSGAPMTGHNPIILGDEEDGDCAAPAH